MPGESEQQYVAWLLYCETGSFDKLLTYWNRLLQGYSEITPELAELKGKLGKPPVRKTIQNWAKKFQWVKRTEVKLAEDLETLREKTKKIKQERLHKIAEAFERSANKILKRLRANEEPTIAEWKQIWEMFRMELGLSTGKQDININPEEQTPTIDEPTKAALQTYRQQKDAQRRPKNHKES